MFDDCTFYNQDSSGRAWKDYHRLREAVRCCNLNLVRSLIESGTQVNKYCDGFRENTPLHLAVASQSLEIVKILLENGANVNVKNVAWDTPLIMAARMEAGEIIDLLLSYNVQQYKKSNDGLTHLHVACMRNKVDVVKKLISIDEHGAKVGKNINRAVKKSLTAMSGFTPLHYAVYYGCIETAKYLLKCGASIMVKDSQGLTPLHWADLRRNEKMIDLLLAAHEYEFENPVGSHGLTHFHIACARDNLSVVKHFLRLGVDPDLRVQKSNCNTYWTGWEPLDLAMYYECPQVIELLLRLKNISKSSIGGYAQFFLKYAFISGNETIYELFTTQKIECAKTLKNFEKISDFHLACIHDDTERMKLCLTRDNNGAPSNLNERMWNGYTPLHLTAKCNSINATKVLLAHGASFEIRDSQNKTPLHIAFESNHPAIMSEIIEKFTELTENLVDDSGLSFLHILCSTDKISAIENFLSNGIDVNIKVGVESLCWSGFTPMHVAYKFKQKEVVELLLKYDAEILIHNGSIFDHFDLAFKTLDQVGGTDFSKVLLDNLVKVLSSPSLRMKYPNNGVSLLHAFCLDIDSSLEPLKRFIISHKHEVNQTIEMPQSNKYHKCTPMHLAMRYKASERGKLMVEAGADPSMVNGAGDTTLGIAYATATNYPFLASKDQKDVFFPLDTPIDRLKPSHFFIASASYLFDFVDRILCSINDPVLEERLLNCRDDTNQTSLHLLSKQYDLGEDDMLNRREMVQLLLEYGAQANAKDYLLQNALYGANDEEVMLILLNHGADVNNKDIFDETPLHAIVKEGSWENSHKSITALLENGADINIEDREGRTALMTMKSFSLPRVGDHMNDWNEDLKCVIVMLKYVITLRSIGWNISQKNQDAYVDLMRRCNGIFNADSFEDECKRELEAMMLKNIDHYTTMRDILFKNLNQMTRYCENRVLQKILEHDGKEFPIYGPLVRLQVERGEIRQPLLKNSKRPSIRLFGRPLPQLCLEEILSYLTDSDLKNIITSDPK